MSTFAEKDDFVMSWRDREILEEIKEDQKAFAEWYDAVEKSIIAEENQNRKRRQKRRKAPKQTQT